MVVKMEGPHQVILTTPTAVKLWVSSWVHLSRGFPGGSTVKNLPVKETLVGSLSWEEPLDIPLLDQQNTMN